MPQPFATSGFFHLAGGSRPLRSDRAYLMLIAFNHEQVLGMLGEVRKRDAREVA